MKEHVDEQVWRGLERRIGQVEKFIPATQPPWRGSRPAITPSIRVVPGSAFGEASRGRRSRGGRGWIRVLVAVAVAIALVIGAILAGGGHQLSLIHI